MSTNIYIQIAGNYVENVVSYLLSTQTPFVLKYSQAEGEHNLKKNPELSPNQAVISPKTHQKDIPLPNLIDEYFSENIATPLPKIEEIAQTLGLSIDTLQNKTKEFFGKSVYQYSVEKRMEAAAHLLNQGHKACEVSKMVGYGEKSAIKFNKMFQKHFGITPKKFQMNAQLKPVNNQS